jgi:hypothetical protein
MVSKLMMAAGGFDRPQALIRVADQTVADFNTVANHASTGDNQAGCGLLLVCGVGDSTGYLVEGVARLHDWWSSAD